MNMGTGTSTPMYPRKTNLEAGCSRAHWPSHSQQLVTFVAQLAGVPVLILGCSVLRAKNLASHFCIRLHAIAKSCALSLRCSQNSFKSSVRRKSTRGSSFKRGVGVGVGAHPGRGLGGSGQRSRREAPAFVVRPAPSPHLRPVLVFVNPRSGSHQGRALLKKFLWLLNPRQVFDLRRDPPKKAYAPCYARLLTLLFCYYEYCALRYTFHEICEY